MSIPFFCTNIKLIGGGNAVYCVEIIISNAIQAITNSRFEQFNQEKFNNWFKKYIKGLELCVCSNFRKWACGQKIDSRIELIDVLRIFDEFLFKCKRIRDDYKVKFFKGVAIIPYYFFIRFASKLHITWSAKFTALYHLILIVSLEKMKTFLTKSTLDPLSFPQKQPRSLKLRLIHQFKQLQKLKLVAIHSMRQILRKMTLNANPTSRLSLLVTPAGADQTVKVQNIAQESPAIQKHTNPCLNKKLISWTQQRNQ